MNINTLKPLNGTVQPFYEQVKELERPYIEISEADHEQLDNGSSDFYLTPDNQVVTFGTADGGYALMPLNADAARQVLEFNAMVTGDAKLEEQRSGR